MREKLVLTAVVALLLFSSILLLLGCFLIVVTDQPGSLPLLGRFAFFGVWFVAPLIVAGVTVQFWGSYRREHLFEHFVEGMPANVVDAYRKLKLEPGTSWNGRQCNPLAVLARTGGVDDTATATRSWATEVLSAPFCGGFVDAWEEKAMNAERARNAPEYDLGYRKGTEVRAALRGALETNVSINRS